MKQRQNDLPHKTACLVDPCIRLLNNGNPMHSAQLTIIWCPTQQERGGKKAFNNSNHIINKTSFYTNLKCEWLFSQSTFYKTTQQSFSKMNFQVIKMLFYIYCNNRLKKKKEKKFPSEFTKRNCSDISRNLWRMVGSISLQKHCNMYPYTKSIFKSCCSYETESTPNRRHIHFQPKITFKRNKCLAFSKVKTSFLFQLSIIHFEFSIAPLYN